MTAMMTMKEPAKKPWKIDQAKGALRFCVNSLGNDDRFDIISFSTTARSFRKTLQPVNNDTREEALSNVARLEILLGHRTNERTRRDAHDDEARRRLRELAPEPRESTARVSTALAVHHVEQRAHLRRNPDDDRVRAELVNLRDVREATPILRTRTFQNADE
jgi:hypothetical protein